MNPNPEFKPDPRLLEVIACPRCLAKLQYDHRGQRFICPFERMAYPIDNGIPIFIAEKAETLNE